MSPADAIAWRARMRDAVASALIQAFGDEPRSCGLMEGGSAATGRLDEHSDIDFGVVTDPSLTDAAFAAVEVAAGTIDRIDEVCPVIESPWPGLVQRFYLFEAAALRLRLALPALRPAATVGVGVFPTGLRRLP